MKKYLFLLIFVVLSLFLAGIVYYNDKTFNIIIDGENYYHYDKKFTKIGDLNSLENNKFKGFVNDNLYDNISLIKKNNIYILTNDYKDLKYDDSLLYDNNRVNIEIIDFDKIVFNEKDYELLYSVLDNYGIGKDDIIGDEYKYEVDLDNDGLKEYICFSTNNTMYEIPNNPYSFLYLVDGNDYSIIKYSQLNKFEGKNSYLNKVFKMEDKTYFIIGLSGYSETNKCNIIYNYNDQLNELLNDC